MPHTAAMEVSQMASKLVSRAVTAAVLMATGLGSVQAAEKIRWEDLQKHVGKLGELRSVNVVTRDGHKHHSRGLTMAGDHLSLLNHQNIEDVARQDVARVEIRQRKRYYRHIRGNVLEALMLPFESETALGLALCAVVAPPFLAYAVASAPVFLATDGIAFLLPPKVFDIVQ